MMTAALLRLQGNIRVALYKFSNLDLHHTTVHAKLIKHEIRSKAGRTEAVHKLEFI